MQRIELEHSWLQNETLDSFLDGIAAWIADSPEIEFDWKAAAQLIGAGVVYR